MIFDKLKYWKNRKEGKRGQGDKPITKIPNNELSKLASRRPKNVARRSVYRVGKQSVPIYDPKSTNHKRMLERKAERDKKRESRTN